MLYSGSGVLIAVGLGVPAGYGLATFDFFGRRLLLFATMIAMLIPSNALGCRWFSRPTRSGC